MKRNEIPYYASMLTVEAFAASLDVKPDTVRRWIARRRLAHVKIGQRCIRIPQSELDRIIEQNMIPVETR